MTTAFCTYRVKTKEDFRLYQRLCKSLMLFLTFTMLFIRKISTIIFSIASPGLWDALLCRHTFELVGTACVTWSKNKRLLLTQFIIQSCWKHIPKSSNVWSFLYHKNHIIIASIIRAFIESHNFPSFSISTKCIFLLSNFKGNGREATFNNSNIPKSKSFVEKVFFTNNFQFCVFLLWPFAFWEKYETFSFFAYARIVLW